MLNTDESVGGAAIACNRLIEALTRHGSNDIEVKLLVLRKRTEKKTVSKVGTKLFLLLEKLYFLFFEKSKNVRFAFSSADFGVDITKHPWIKDADIVHLHWINQGFLSLTSIEKLLATKKNIFWSFHDMWPMTGGCHHSNECENFTNRCGNCTHFLRNASAEDLSYQIFKKKKNWIHKEKINVVSISQWMNQRISVSNLFKNNPILQIPNPLDESVFRPIGKKHFQQQNGFDADTTHILFVAAQVDNYFKGFGLFIEILEKLITQKRKIKVLLVGKIKDHNSLSRLPCDYIHYGLIDNDERMNEIYNLADVYLSTSPNESFSYTCLEAAFTKTPIIAFSTGEIPAIVEHKKNGFLVENYTISNFLLGFEWLFSPKKLQIENENIIQLYSYKKISSRMIEGYKQTLLGN